MSDDTWGVEDIARCPPMGPLDVPGSEFSLEDSARVGVYSLGYTLFPDTAIDSLSDQSSAHGSTLKQAWLAGKSTTWDCRAAPM